MLRPVLLALLALAACTQGRTDDSGPAVAPAPVGPPYAIPLAGCYYYRTATTNIGAQAFHLLIDSGSATMAVSATGCESCVDDEVSTLYDTSHGTDEGRTASCRYDLGEMGWEGEVYTDDVSMGGIPPVPLRFAAVTDQDYMFGTFPCDGDDNVPVDGILGLRQDSTLERGTDSYLSAVVREAAVPDAFAMHICNTGGTLWMGGYEPDETTGEMAFVPLASDSSYSVNVKAFEVEHQSGVRIEAPVSSTWNHLAGLLDSGGPHLLIPRLAYDVVIDAISSDPAFSKLGDISWWDSSRGTNSSLSPAELDALLPRLLVDLTGDPDLQLSLPASSSYLQWEATVGGTYNYWHNLSADDSLLDLGNLPMYTYVVYTDRVGGRIGFAPAEDCP